MNALLRGVVRKHLAAICLWLSVASLTAPGADYANDIKPLLDQHCLKCHGPEKQKSGFRVDRRTSWLAGGDLGVPALIPHQPAKSHVLSLLRGDNPDERMPPKGDPLKPEQIAQMTAWISAGALMPDETPATSSSSTWWSFAPLTKPLVPAAPQTNPIDVLLTAALHKQDLHMQPAAPAQTQLLRAALVLTGLPLPADELSAALSTWNADPDGTYARVIDRLLASPRFGERYASHWLDVIRWAETSGSESNYYRKNAWMFRDWVVDAFNADLSYRDFITRQIAGDVMGDDVATGYLVAGPHVPGETVGQEISAMREARMNRLDDIVQTVGTSVLGLTVGCARCHNHKFDPISIQDYYAMVAVFQDVEYDVRMPRLPSQHPRQRTVAELAPQLAEVRAQLAHDGAWVETWSEHHAIQLPAQLSSPASVSKARQVRLTFGEKSVALDEIAIFDRHDGGVDLALEEHGTRVTTFLQAENPGKPPRQLIDGQYHEFWGWKAKREDGDGPIWIQLDLADEHPIARIEISQNRFPHQATDYLDGYESKLPPVPTRIEVRSTDDEPWRLVATSKELHARAHAADSQSTLAKLHDLISRQERDGPQMAFIGRFITPAKTQVLLRGNPMTPGDDVAPAGLSLAHGDLGQSSASSGPDRRLAFARWLTSDTHPLTARVWVNRIWHTVFGQGLVSTPGDFGHMGAHPSNPELLDWLASTFIADGWSTKRLLRQILLTQAFRQDSAPSVPALAADAGSALLWRFPPRRLDAEVLRDRMLLAADILDERRGGVGYRIHNVKKRFTQWTVEDNSGPATWRRMLYQERMRGIDDRMFTAFDFPECGQIQAKRTVSTTPLQALNLLNGPLVSEIGARLTERITATVPADDDARLSVLFIRLLNREPSASERAACRPVLAHDGLAAVARVLINSNAFVFLN